MMKVTVGKAPSQGTYRGEITFDLAFGNNRMAETEVATLTANFSLISRSTTETNREGETETTESAAVTLEDGEFVCKKSKGDDHKTFKLPADGLNHESFVSAILLVRSLDLTKAGTYTFRELDWPELASEGAAQEEPQARVVKVKVSAASEYEHRGKKLQVHRLLVTRPGEEDTTFVVDSRNRLLGFWPAKAPIKMVLAADAAEQGGKRRGGRAAGDEGGNGGRAQDGGRRG